MTTDWVTHACGVVRGGVVVHVIHSTMTGLQMSRILGGKGIKSWGWAMDPEGSVSFRVGRQQAQFARDVLRREGAVCV